MFLETRSELRILEGAFKSKKSYFCHYNDLEEVDEDVGGGIDDE